MRRDSGAVLINALVIVLVISAIAAALLTRAEGARIRGASGQVSAQLELYLDGIEGLLPTLLKEQLDGGVTHLGQPWAQREFAYQIDRGGVTAGLRDLQGGLNVNWLVSGDAYASETFARLFAELGIPVSLVDAIADFVRPGGPMRLSVYLERSPPILPHGGAIAMLPELRQVEGMTEALYQRLVPYLTALPPETRLNLNTAPKPVLRAALEPFPSELVSQTMARGLDDPLEAMSEFRNRLIEILETEDLDAYPVERLSVASEWFGARLVAGLDSHARVRQVVLRRVFEPRPVLRVAYRWTEYD